MVITLASQKGGAGKTSTAIAVWASFPRSLLIDLDPQLNSTSGTGANRDETNNSYSVLIGKCSLQEATQSLEKGDVVAASYDLDDITTLPPATLSEALISAKNKYQHIILDTPPALNAITFAAISAADVLIVPMQGDKYSLEGLDRLMDIVDVARESYNPLLKIGGILLTRFNGRSILRREIRKFAEEYVAQIGARVFKSTIREAVAVPESQMREQDIFSYAPHAKVTSDYRAFIEELREVLQHD